MILDVFTILFEAETRNAQDSLADLGERAQETGEQTEEASRSIEDQAADLYLLSRAAGMSSQAARAYTEAQLGATEADLEKARAAMDAADAVQESGEEAKKASNSFEDYAKKAIAALSVHALLSGVLGRADDIAAIERTGLALGEATEDVHAFGGAMELLGGDAQGARDSLTDMSESIGEALQDVESGRAKTFEALGVSLRDVEGNSIGAIEGMMRLADAVGGMSEGEAIFRLKELGITDNRMVEAITKGRKELERLMAVQKAANPLTKEQVQNAKQLNSVMDVSRNSIKGAASQFFDMLIPALTKALEWLIKVADWAGEHKDVVVGFFGAVATIVTAIYVPAMIKAAAATLAATWPMIAIGAAVVAAGAAFALLYDDIMHFMDGNDSMIGQIFEKYPMVKDMIYGIIDAFKFMGDVVGQVFSTLVAGFQQVVDFIARGISQIASGISTVAGFFGIGGDVDISGANEQMAAASANPMNAVSSNAISNTANNNRETNVQVGQVTVQTQATDSQGISQAIGGDLSAQLKNLEAETATGIDR